jgi:hypothetical protein
MQKLSRIARIDVAVAALVAAVAAMPAFAALPFDVPFAGNGLPLRDWILMGSLALLAVAVALRLMRHRGRSRDAVSDGPDLRWWRNS